MLRITDVQMKSCSFSWEKLKELKENRVEVLGSGWLDPFTNMEAERFMKTGEISSMRTGRQVEMSDDSSEE